MLSTRNISTRLGARVIPEKTIDGRWGRSRVASVTHIAHVLRLLDLIDRHLAMRLRPLALPCLRVLLGVLFLWFGGLKVAGDSPVQAMVAGTLPWANPHVIVPVLGGVEVLIGLGLVTGVALRLALPALAAHLAGTFLTFVMLPAQMFRDANPLLLTEDGEFVTKNLVLIAAALVLIAHTSRPDRDSDPDTDLNLGPIPLPRAPS